MTISVYQSLYKIANGTTTADITTTPGQTQGQSQGQGQSPQYTFWNWLSQMFQNPFGTFTGGFTGQDPWGRAMSYGLTGFGGAGLLTSMLGLPKWLPWLIGLGGGLYGYFTGNRGGTPQQQRQQQQPTQPNPSGVVVAYDTSEPGNPIPTYEGYPNKPSIYNNSSPYNPEQHQQMADIFNPPDNSGSGV